MIIKQCRRYDVSQTERGNRTSTPPWSGSSKSGKLGKIRKFLERGATVIYHMLALMLNLLTRAGGFFFCYLHAKFRTYPQQKIACD